MQPFKNISAKSVIETKPLNLFPTPSAPPISGILPLTNLLIYIVLWCYKFNFFLLQLHFKFTYFIDSLDSFDSDPYGNENNQNVPNTIHSSSALNKLNNRAHNFIQKSVIIPEICGPCGKK